MKKPELLSPAGTLNNMRYALSFGADAVYAGQPRYSLRVRNNDFNLNHLAIGIEETHRQGKKFYVAANIMAHNRKVNTFLKDLAPIVNMHPDALIMSDPGLIMMVRENWPQLPVHLSVQANTVNYASVKFWHSVGIQRIILSRELALDEIEEIKQRCPEIELEVFVHGALCIAYSGRCLLSGYFNHRDANQGTCTNSCRWDYSVQDDKDTSTFQAEKMEKHEQAQKTYLLEEKKRPGEYMPIEEDEHGTYILNSKDLRAVEHIDRLIKIGIDSVKIEGRTKSQYYVARVTQVYRQSIDNAIQGKEFDVSALGALDGLANRGYTDGFFVRHHNADYQNYLQGNSRNHLQLYVGDVLGYNPERRRAEIDVKNKITVGDSLELILPTGNVRFDCRDMEDNKGQVISEAPGGGYRISLPVPVDNVEKGLLAKYLK